MDFSTIAGMAGGHAEARAIQVAFRLGLFEKFRTDSHTAESLARALGSDRRATMLLANALVALGLLLKRGDHYGIAEDARRFVVKASAEYLGDMILFDAALWDEWGRLEESVRTGRPARTPDMYQSDPAATERFISAMDSLVRARGDAPWTAAHLDFSFARTIADLGGGPGTYLVEFLRLNPKLLGELWDLPATLAVAHRILSDRMRSAPGRIRLREVDYLAGELPGPVDAIFMSNVIHSEDEAVNRTLMVKCFRALNRGGMIALKDHIMDDDLIEPAGGAIFSLYLLLTTRGRDYSFNETAEWLGAAGFDRIERITLPRPPFSSSIVTARKA